LGKINVVAFACFFRFQNGEEGDLLANGNHTESVSVTVLSD